jgi:hypothetical protein
VADVPVNEKLYAMVVFQAKAKYRIYPSPGASHWVHQRYLELGGKFEDSEKIAERKDIMRKIIERRREAREKHEDSRDRNKKKAKK